MLSNFCYVKEVMQLLEVYVKIPILSSNSLEGVFMITLLAYKGEVGTLENTPSRTCPIYVIHDYVGSRSFRIIGSYQII